MKKKAVGFVLIVLVVFLAGCTVFKNNDEKKVLFSELFDTAVMIGTGTPNDEVCTGTCQYAKIGRLLFISITDLAFNQGIIDNETIIFSNVPEGIHKVFLITQYQTGNVIRLALGGGKITAWYDTIGVSSLQYYGTTMGIY